MFAKFLNKIFKKKIILFDNFCSICLENFNDLIKNNLKIQALNCGHVFCVTCILHVTICPMCRTKIRYITNLENYNICHMCKNYLIDQQLKNYLLCGHTFCYKCAVKMKNHNNFYKCYFCKRYSTIHPLYF